ncbi:MAG: PASTA domain-containing protein [Chlorobiaceae bacterium]|nr:PASTA domain-containing protein [Chlorobiaceae bacterium]
MQIVADYRAPLPHIPDTSTNTETAPGRSPASGHKEYRVKPAPRKVLVPDLVGKTVESAKRILRLKQLALGSIVYRESLEQAGMVMAQNPLPKKGLRVAAGSPVTLVVSRSMLAVVPDVVGRTVSDARPVLQKAGFLTGSVVPDSFVSSGKVRRQHPVAGDSARRGSAVDLTVTDASPEPKAPEANQELVTYLAAAIVATGGAALLLGRLRRNNLPGRKRKAVSVTPKTDFGVQDITIPSGAVGKRETGIRFFPDKGVQEITVRQVDETND